MIDDNPIDYKSEYNKSINKLVKLRQKYDELEEDKDYVKSLLDVEFEKRIKLQKENEELKKNCKSYTWYKEFKKLLNENEHLKKENDILKASNGEYEDALARLEEENEQLKQAYTKLKQRHSLLHDEIQELEYDKDEYYKDVLFLEKENRELKQLISKTLREQYHLIKNEDKTGALVELKSIAAYLGVDLE